MKTSLTQNQLHAMMNLLKDVTFCCFQSTTIFTFLLPLLLTLQPLPFRRVGLPSWEPSAECQLRSADWLPDETNH